MRGKEPMSASRTKPPLAGLAALSMAASTAVVSFSLQHHTSESLSTKQVVTTLHGQRTTTHCSNGSMLAHGSLRIAN